MYMCITSSVCKTFQLHTSQVGDILMHTVTIPCDMVSMIFSKGENYTNMVCLCYRLCLVHGKRKTQHHKFGNLKIKQFSKQKPVALGLFWMGTVCYILEVLHGFWILTCSLTLVIVISPYLMIWLYFISRKVIMVSCCNEHAGLWVGHTLSDATL